MQKNAGKNTKKLYFTTAIISFVLVLAISLTLIFTLGGRSSGGSGNGNNSGEIGSVSTTLSAENGTLTAGTGLSATSTTTKYNVKVTNSSDFPVYLRARVILTGSAAQGGNYFNYDSAWTYAADNYLYYKDAVAKDATSTALFTTARVTGVYRFVVEALQEDAAVPTVVVKVGSTEQIEGALGESSCTLIQNGLKKYHFNTGDLSSTNNSFTITNKGKQDLDVKFRIASSEWMVKGAKVVEKDRQVEWFPNAGYYQLVDKLAIGETVTITLDDANKNNGVSAESTTIDLTLQDYIVATDVYSLVNKTTLQNVGTKVSGKIGTYSVSGSDLANLAVYSYNNTNKFVFVKTTGVGFKYGDAWGKIEGENTGISGTVIAPKSCSELLYKSDSETSGTYEITIQTAQTIDNKTIEVIQATGALSGSNENYKPVSGVDGTVVSTTSSMILDAGKGHTASEIISKWGKLAVKSNDSSDILVRVSLSFAWGTLNGDNWVPNTDALGFSPSVFYGDGFSFNSEDQSLTYNYNLANGQATSALLEFPATASSDNSATEEQKEFAKMISAINAKNQALKLSVMVEAIYAIGSQLDILKIDGSQSSASGNYYTSTELKTEGEELGTNVNYISMTKTSGMIYGDVSSSANATAFVNSLNKYVVYVTNNFPVGVRVAVALQWGTYSNGVWTAATTDVGANSTINLGQYLTSNWEFDTSLGGYNYKCSIPGKCATAPIFASDLTALATAISDEYTSRSDTTNKYVRVVIMAETTHKV